MRRFWVSAVLAGLTIAAAFSWGCSKPPAAEAPPPPVVLVAPVEQRDVPIYGEWTGTSDGFVNAQVRAQVQGYLMRQCYREGSKVKKGDLLFEIDPRPFQAALDQALAQWGKTELDVKRLTPLAKEQAVSQQELDDAVQGNLANKAAVEAAQLNLGFTKITSPVDGIAGIATAQVGNLVGPTTGELTIVSTVDPIKIYFQVSEKEYLESPAFFSFLPPSEPPLDPVIPPAKTPGKDAGTRDIELVLTNGSVYPQPGKLFFVSREVDPRTGTLQVGALFPNPGDVLRPGQFARVRGILRSRAGALLVPQRAVTELQGSYEVAVVGSDDKASVRPVTVGDRVGPKWIIESGLKAGESVVVEGVQKASEGALVSPKPYVSAAPPVLSAQNAAEPPKP